MKDLELCERLTKTLGGDGPQRVVLAGKSGIGKTRLANMVGEHAKKALSCYFTLCLYLDNKFEDELSLYENIAFQLGVYDRDKKEEEKSEDLIQILQKNISEILWVEKRRTATKMHEMMLLADRKARERAKKLKAEGFPKEERIDNTSDAAMPYILLILDDEGNKTSEEKVMKGLGLENFLNKRELDVELNVKLLITRREGDINTIKCTEKIEPRGTRSEGESESYIAAKGEELKKSHTTDESQALLGTLTEDNLQDLFESLIEDEARNFLQSLRKGWKTDEPLISRVALRSNSLPAAIVVLAKSLNCITHQNNIKSPSPKQEKVLKEALYSCDPAYSDSRYNPTLHLAYDLLETDDRLNSAIVDCFWHSLDFFKHCGGVYYGDLITHWILEGYFDPIKSVKKAYKDGHEILVELINRGILKIRDREMIVPEMAMNNLIDLRHHGLLGRSRLQFSRVCGGEKNKGLGRIIQIDDMIKTVQAKNEADIRTLLVNGNRLRRERPQKFFQKMGNLEVLGLFAPTVDRLIPSLELLVQLRVLVIRDYDLLTSMEKLKVLQRLEVLEVSGASSVETISDDFFEAMSKLQSLNLSGLRIKSSPSSISRLKNLCSLILRDCPVLEDLPDIQQLNKLEVVDVRGACKLKSCFGKGYNSSGNRTFHKLQQLQHLDLSESKIRRLPVFHDAAVAENLCSLTRLSLHNCSDLVKLPNLKPLSALQILDLSGTTSLVEITEVCFEQKDRLKILNLSGTIITKLPSTISGLSSLSQLLLRDSSNLEDLPNIEALTSLEVFDVSGCTKLHNIEGSFKGMSYLREVNLSGTRIETLPELPEKSRMCCSKLFVLADSRRLIHDTWSQVKKSIKNGMSEDLSSSDMVNRFENISRKESGRANEVWAFDYQGPIYKNIYMNTIPFVDIKTCQEVLEIQGSNGVNQDKETLAKAEFVVFVDNNAATISSIYSDLKSVNGCWLEMCGDIEILFFGVDEERLRNLKTLSITNLRRLKSICSSSFTNLKQLNVDCCPSINTLFPASVLPTSLEVLEIKFCERLEKVFEEVVELPNLHTLCLFELPVLSTIGAKLPTLRIYKDNKCPKLKTSEENLREGRWPM